MENEEIQNERNEITSIAFFNKRSSSGIHEGGIEVLVVRIGVAVAESAAIYDSTRDLEGGNLGLNSGDLIFLWNWELDWGFGRSESESERVELKNAGNVFVNIR
jgi:hypothetical protein